MWIEGKPLVDFELTLALSSLKKSIRNIFQNISTQFGVYCCKIVTCFSTWWEIIWSDAFVLKEHFRHRYKEASGRLWKSFNFFSNSWSVSCNLVRCNLRSNAESKTLWHLWHLKISFSGCFLWFSFSLFSVSWRIFSGNCAISIVSLFWISTIFGTIFLLLCAKDKVRLYNLLTRMGLFLFM